MVYFFRNILPYISGLKSKLKCNFPVREYDEIHFWLNMNLIQLINMD